MAFFDFLRRKEGTPASLALSQPIGEKQIRAADQLLMRYKEGKAHLDQRIIDNERWYRMAKQDKQKGDVKAKTGWLFNCLANKHAEAMDSFPRPNVLPREESDEEEAQRLSSIIPVILDHADFEETYSDVQMYKLKTGTGVYGVFWDPTELNGLGDITIRKVDLLNLFWEPGVHNIQDSPNLFFVQLVDNDRLKSQYPQLENKLSTPSVTIVDYSKEDAVDTSTKSAVVDWYYKRNLGGKDILHFCKYCNGVVLYSTENDESLRERGIYDHGEYPFIFESLYKTEGTPAGFGFIDVGKWTQEQIDLGGQAIIENMLAGARPRYFERIDGSINEEEFVDWTKQIVHVEGNLGDDSIRPVDNYPLNGAYLDVLNMWVDQLKETTGNRDVANGGTTGGVTAASGIAAMQEAGAKLARDNNKSAYRAYRKLILMVIELIRQFYDAPRQFRIIGDQGAREFVTYDNSGLRGVYIDPEDPSAGMTLPVFDIQVTAEKASPYSRMAQNELALDFYNRGFFDPTRADQALMCLEMMDFDGKDRVMQKIQAQGGMFQQMLMLAQMLDKALGTNVYYPQVLAQYGIDPAPTEKTPETGQESSVTANARQRVAESTQV